MGFVSEGKGLGATFFFELPVYSAAFTDKELQKKRAEAGTHDQISFPTQSNNASIKPMSVSPKSSRSSRVYVMDSPSTACDSDAVEEFRPPFFDIELSQESDSLPPAQDLG